MTRLPAPGDESSLATLQPDPADPEVERARGAVQERLLGVPAAPVRIGRFVVLERIGAGGMGIVYSAYDPQLDRKVAIKLLFERSATPRAQGRIVREAKAMARLAHPNVVHVYEVGEHGGRVFVAMEYVHGKTLRRWWASTRSSRELLDVCLQAGRGLAAAHAVGLVHGDFKPDNVIVGDDGRARVLDFGLARTDDEAITDADRSEPHVGALQRKLATDARMGTPGYVAPAQLRGEPADAASDQFAFCVTVWEAFVGALPFTASDCAAAAMGGAPLEVRDAPRTKLPSWIEQVLRRGLSETNRWATMDELLHALGRDPASVWRRRIAFASTIAGIGIAFAVGSAMRTTQEDPCAGAPAQLDAAWEPTERAALLDAIAQDGEYGIRVGPRLAAQLDDWQARWIGAHRDACTTHLRGDQSDELFERRAACLDRMRNEFGAIGSVGDTMDGQRTVSLTTSIMTLPAPETCGDLDRLRVMGDPGPPEAKPVAVRLAKQWAQFRVNDYAQVASDMPQLVADARESGHRSLIAEALHLQAVTLLEIGEYSEVPPLFREATELALASGADEVATQSWSNRAWAAGTRRTQDPDALDGKRLMETFAEARVSPSRVSSFHINLGSAELALGNRDEARRHLVRAVEMARTSTVRDSDVLARALGNLALVTDEPAARDRILLESIEVYSEVLGVDHPRTLEASAKRAAMMVDSSAALIALRPVCNAMWELHRQRADVHLCMRTLRAIADDVGDAATASSASARMLDTNDPSVRARVQVHLEWWRGDARRAAELAEPLTMGAPPPGEGKLKFFQEATMGEVELVLGRAWRALGDPRADAMLRRAVARFDAAVAVQPTPVYQRQQRVARRLVDDPMAR